MIEQEYRIENIKSFELADIFDCGQCFRWNKQDDGSYTICSAYNGKLLEMYWKSQKTIGFEKIPCFSWLYIKYEI